MRDKLIHFLHDIVGSALYGFGIRVFAEPADFAPGGVSGLALIINHLWGLPVGALIFLINIPILMWGYFKLGRGLILRTLITIAVSSAMLDSFITPIFAEFTGSRLIAAVCSGLLMGLGLSVIFISGSTTGGTEIAADILRLKWTRLSMGRAILAIDILLILVSVPVFGNILAGVYGALSLICCTWVIDMSLSGFPEADLPSENPAKPR